MKQKRSNLDLDADNNSSHQLQKRPTADSKDLDVEAHVFPLLHSIGGLKLEKIDLTTEEASLNTIPALDAMLEKIQTYQRAASTLRAALEEKRDKLASELQ